MHSIQEKKQRSLLFHITETEFSSGSCVPLGLQRLDDGITQKLNVEKRKQLSGDWSLSYYSKTLEKSEHNLQVEKG